MQKLKHIGLVFIFLLVVSTLKPALAQSPGVSDVPVQQTSSNMDAVYGNVNPDVPRNLHTLTQTTIIEVISGTICALSGRDPLNPNGTCLGFNPKNGKIGYVSQNSGGVAQIMGGFIGSTMSIPVSSGDYARYAISNFGVVKSAYAQAANGQGFARLTPLVGVWAKFRDIAYLAFVLAFTIIGLAVMFRVKIDARTVMTIQNQIPKIVVALILVTFSYAIVGFLIDMMYVGIYLILIMFSSIGSGVHVNPNASVFSVMNHSFNAGKYHPGPAGIINLTYQMSAGIGGVFSNLTTDFLDSTIGTLFKIPFAPLKVLDLGCDAMGFLSTYTFQGFGLGHIPYLSDFLQGVPVVGGLFGGSPSCDFVDTFFAGVIAFLFGAVAFLVVLIAIIYTLFRVWFTLIKSFIYVLVDAMIGPLWIAAGIFPGSKLGFGTWVRHLMAHLSVFPMTFAVILLGKTIMDSISSNGGQLFSPPLVGDAIGGNDFLAAVVGFGFILSLPGILDRTRKAVGAIDFGLKDVRASIVGVGGGLARGGLQSATARDIEYTQNKTTGQWEPKGIGWGPRRILKGFGLVR